MSYALDVNLLLYASDAKDPLGKKAAEFLQDCAERAEPLYLSWSTLLAYLRSSTHGAIFAHPLTPERAEENVEALLRLPQVRLLTEQEGFWEVYRSVSAAHVPRGRLVPDVHLAALLKQHGIRTLYTHDADFRRFDFLQVIDPLRG